jgi:hypothetical protein
MADERRGLADRALDRTDSKNPKLFEKPSCEAISLCCEISAYAPDDGDWPLI